MDEKVTKLIEIINSWLVGLLSGEEAMMNVADLYSDEFNDVKK